MEFGEIERAIGRNNSMRGAMTASEAVLICKRKVNRKGEAEIIRRDTYILEW